MRVSDLSAAVAIYMGRPPRRRAYEFILLLGEGEVATAILSSASSGINLSPVRPSLACFWRTLLKIDPGTSEDFSHILTGVVVPRPIAFVSSISAGGRLNLAPFSFYNAVSFSPPTLVIAISRHAETKEKDTLANIEATREFVVNVVVDDIAEAMNRTAAEYPADFDEFTISGLTPTPSDLVRPPRVAESPVNMECRLDQVVPIGSGEEETGLVIGEILLFHIRDGILQGGRIDQDRLRPTGRLSGSMYCHTLDVFRMARPVYDGGS